MLSTANTPMVSGMRFAPMKTVRVKVLRPFLMKGEPQPIGTVLEVDAALAGELLNASKAERVAPPVKEEAPMPKGKKGHSNAE